MAAGEGLGKLLKKALHKHQVGDAQGAEKFYKKILRSAPDHLDATYLLGTLYAERGDTERALKYTLRAQEAAPESPYVQNNLGNIYRLRGDWEAAARCFRRALELHPLMPEAHNNLGVVLKRLGAIQDAIAHYRLALDIQPLFGDAHYNLAKAYFDSEQYDLAFSSYERAVQIAPRHTLALDGLGIVHMKRGARAAALECFQRCLELDPRDACGARLKIAALGAGAAPEKFPHELVRQIYEHKAPHWEQDIARPEHRFLGPEHVGLAVERYCAARGQLDILDIGCGTGLCGMFLRPIAQTLVGVDLSPHMLAVAQQKNLYDRLEAREVVEYMSAPGLSYDLIVASGVMIFFGDLAPVFAAAAHALKSGGLFIFTLYRSDVSDIAVRSNWHFAHHEAHVRARAQHAGLEVEQLHDIVHEYEDGKPQAGYLTILRKA